MFERIDETNAGAVWYCEDCYVWWGSQIGEQATTRFLLQLPATLTDALDWKAYRGWRYAGNALQCPVCGRSVIVPKFAVGRQEFV